jgi:sulfur-carrier protein
MINLEVVLFATLRRYNPYGESSDPFLLQLPVGSTVEQILNELKIPPHESKQVYVNSLRREKDYILQDGQRVAVFPPIAGG